MLKLLVTFTPVVGAIVLPLVIPVTIARLGIGTGIVFALVLSTIWFFFMLKTSEMPH